MGDIGTAYVRIAPSTQGLSSAISKALGGAGGPAGQAMGESSKGGFLKSGFMGAVAGTFATIASKGIDLVQQNLGAAINRYDTIKNFPKVMENFGISADEAARVMKDKLSPALQGIPTTMDSAITAVQNFTAKTGDVDKATDLFVAFNNAVLAGGKSLGEQESAMYQFTKSFSTGKMDMMSWRAVVNAMPAQLDQVAQAMGHGKGGVEKLGAALRSGETSMEDFTKKIVEMNEKGIEGFPSLADQAKNATGGIETAMANMKTSVVRGLANMIEKIDDAAKDNGLPTFAEVINGVSKIINDAFGVIGDIIGAVSKTIQDFMKSNAGKRMAETFGKLSEAAEGFGGPGQILQDIFSALAEIIMGVGASVLEIINGIREGIEKFANSPSGKKLAETIEAIGKQFSDIFGFAEGEGPTFVDFLEGLGEAFSIIAQVVGEFVSGAAQVFLTIIEGIRDGIEKFANSPAGKQLAETLQSIGDKFSEIFSSVEGDGPSFIDFLDGLGEVISVIAQGVGYAVLAVATAIDFIILIIQGIVEFIIGVVEGVQQSWNGLCKFFCDDIPAAFNAFRMAVMTIFNAVVGFFSGIVKGVIGIWQAIVTFFTVTIPNAFTFFFRAVQQTAENVKGAVKNIFDNIWNGLKELPSKVITIGSDLVKGLFNGINDMAKWILDRIREFGESVLNGLKSIFGISSPSKETAKMGRHLIQGLGKGVEQEKGRLLNYLDGVANDITKAFGLSGSIGSFNGNVNLATANPAGYKQVNIYQTVKPANTLKDIYNQTKFGVKAADAV